MLHHRVLHSDRYCVKKSAKLAEFAPSSKLTTVAAKITEQPTTAKRFTVKEKQNINE